MYAFPIKAQKRLYWFPQSTLRDQKWPKSILRVYGGKRGQTNLNIWASNKKKLPPPKKKKEDVNTYQ